jgi:hypothetical protein
MDFQFLEMHLLFMEMHLNLKKNAKSISEINFFKIKNPFAKIQNAFPKSWNKNFKLCKRHMQ